MRRPVSMTTSEINEFRNGCERLGHQPSCYALKREEEVPPHPGPIRRFVIVECRGTRIEFDAGAGFDWISAALKAIEDGRFR